MSETALFPGVYRGVVHDNRDPLGKGRIKVRVPQVLGSTPTSWAWPIAPTSNIEVATPAVGEGVFVAFEGGDPSYPLWMGLFSGTLDPVGAGTNGKVVRYSPIVQATGLTFTGTGATYPTYNSHYVKNGHIVSFFIEIDLATVTNFGTGQYKTELPFLPLPGAMNHFQAWCLVDETSNPDTAGHAILQADHLADTLVLDLHYLKQAGGANSPIMEAMFKQGSPVTLTTATHVYINGTYITAQ